MSNYSIVQSGPFYAPDEGHHYSNARDDNECRSFCDFDNECQSYSFYNKGTTGSGHTCKLMRSTPLTKLMKSVPSMDIVTYKRNQPFEVSKPECYEGKKFSKEALNRWDDTSMRKPRTDTAYECTKECCRASGCTAWSWEATTNNCFLSRQPPSTVSYVPDPGWSSGKQSWSSGLDCCTIQKGTGEEFPKSSTTGGVRKTQGTGEGTGEGNIDYWVYVGGGIASFVFLIVVTIILINKR